MPLHQQTQLESASVAQMEDKTTVARLGSRQTGLHHSISFLACSRRQYMGRTDLMGVWWEMVCDWVLRAGLRFAAQFEETQRPEATKEGGANEWGERTHLDYFQKFF